MAILLLDGVSATYGTQWWSTVDGVTVNSSTVHNQPRSLRYGSFAYSEIASTIPDAGRASCYVNFEAFAGTVGIDVMFVFTASLYRFRVRITPAGVVQVIGVSSIQQGGDGSTLSTGTWYRISCAWNMTSSTTGSMKVWINGVIDISLTNPDFSFGTGTTMYQHNGANSGSNIFYISDDYLDNDTSVTDPGDIRVTAKLPTSANANNFDTTGGTGAVNERPLSETNYKQHAGSGAVAQNYGIESAASGDADVSGATIVGRGAWIWAKGAAGGSGTPKITNNGSDVTIALTSAPKLFTDYAVSSTYPSNAATVGMVSTGSTDDTFLYECGMLIAYIPGGAPAGDNPPPFKRWQQRMPVLVEPMVDR